MAYFCSTVLTWIAVKARSADNLESSHHRHLASMGVRFTELDRKPQEVCGVDAVGSVAYKYLIVNRMRARERMKNRDTRHGF
jgi:hypothetical protein